MNETTKWGIITAITLLFFTCLIPVNIFASAIYLIVIVGAVAITFVSVKLLVSIFLKDLTKAAKNDEGLDEGARREAMAKAYNPSGCVILPVILVLFWGAVALLIWREVEMEKNEIHNYGQLTEANIIDGSSISSRKFDFSKIVLGFKKIDGDSAFVNHSITAKQFENFYKGEPIVIIYSTRYPSIMEVINTKAELDEYLKDHPVKK
ncbi:hypothetical protein [Mucilaginibacter endophyticus]|uniref:hypothetical protein n=1 Tax=Mucilaginibacter endophyticus TaxID=2675003 RepID=UPI000E0D80AA|nr:hypothetical protein [Mucilaginibacter endophyticus]